MRVFITVLSACIALTSQGHAQQCDPVEVGIIYNESHTHRDFFGVECDLQGGWMMINVGQDVRNADSSVVYVYQLISNNWVYHSTIESPSPLGHDQFGARIRIQGERAIIGARYDDEYLPGAGAVYEYIYDGSDWVMDQKITANIPIESEGFGRCFSISSDANTLLVTSLTQNFSGENTGAGYVFERVNGDFVQTQKITPSNQTTSDWFGNDGTLMPDGNTLAISALGGSDLLGSFYVFKKINNIWVEQGEYNASDPIEYGYFGSEVIATENQFIVSATNGNDPDGFPPTWVGAVYVFEHNGSDWIETQKITAEDGNENDYFGEGIKVASDRLLIGTEGKGAAYLYKLDGNQWVSFDKLEPSGIAPENGGANTFAMDSRFALFGEFIGVNPGSPAGGIYVFDLNCDTQSCPADLNGDGELNFFDVTAFIVAFNSEDLLADFNMDGQFNFFDIPVFIAAFQAGCP